MGVVMDRFGEWTMSSSTPGLQRSQSAFSAAAFCLVELDAHGDHLVAQGQSRVESKLGHARKVRDGHDDNAFATPWPPRDLAEAERGTDPAVVPLDAGKQQDKRPGWL